jgi:hypothetical protein
VTRLKHVFGTVRFIYQVICNLSTTLKGIALKAEEGFKEVASSLTRNNRVIEATAVIQRLDFALTQLEMYRRICKRNAVCTFRQYTIEFV